MLPYKIPSLFVGSVYVVTFLDEALSGSAAQISFFKALPATDLERKSLVHQNYCPSNKMSSTQWFLIHSTIVYSANLYFISETFALPRRGKRDASREKQAIDAKVIDAKEESGGRREKDPNTLFPLVSSGRRRSRLGVFARPFAPDLPFSLFLLLFRHLSYNSRGDTC